MAFLDDNSRLFMHWYAWMLVILMIPDCSDYYSMIYLLDFSYYQKAASGYLCTLYLVLRKADLMDSVGTHRVDFVAEKQAT